jgi:Ricin-type beta-trefoil lectin domain
METKDFCRNGFPRHRPRWAFALSLVSLAACSAPSEHAGSSAEDLSTTAAPLIGVGSGLCMDVKHNVTTSGTPLQIYSCNGGPNQAFSFTAASELRAFNGAQCVEPQSGSASPLPAVIAPCDGQAHQRWTLNADGSIQSQSTGMCLDVYARETAIQTPVNLWSCNGQTNQSWSSFTPRVPVSVTTNRYDNVRSGSNTHEYVLNAANVGSGSFGQLYSFAVDGYLYAQPLYLSGLTLANGTTHDVVFAATMHNSVYAFDATGSTTTPLWSVSLGPSGPVNVFDCTDTVGEVGITSTPVIDEAAGTIYVVAKGVENGSWVQRLHLLDVTSGHERPGSPIVIGATVSGTGVGAVNGKVSFNPEINLNRSGLLLNNGILYMAFASHCDQEPYHGWILGYTYANGALAQTQVFNISPNGSEGGIWQGGVGLSADANGLYFAGGNGSTNPSSTSLDLSESVVRTSLTDLSVQDYWIPQAFSSLNAADADMSTGAILMPHNRLLSGSKDGQLYVLDRANFGKYNASGDQILQKLTTPGKTAGELGHVHGGPIYYAIPAGPEEIYVWPEEGGLLAYQLDPSTYLLETPETQSNIYTPGHPGGILTLSSNGTAGSGVLWASIPQSDAWHQTEPGTLYAVDPTNITKVLWSSEQNAARDAVGNFAKFTPPVVANGRVFLATFSNVLRVYGLLN